MRRKSYFATMSKANLQTLYKKSNRFKKICWANTDSFDDSDVIIVGIPNESGSYSRSKGTAKAPDIIRKISNERDVYVEKDLRCLALPTDGLRVRILDYGNIKRTQIPRVIGKISSSSKLPIIIGGDHSNTTHIIKTLSERVGPISLVYFDAHPDFVGHTRNYYGSIITDCLDYIDFKSSIQIGIRTPEWEELDNIKRHGLQVITPFDIAEKGIKQITRTVLQTIKNNVYVSLDMDCLDPAYAPGVSVPVPMGLESQDVVFLIKKIAQRGIIGLDIMEVCPNTDLNNITSHFASRLVGEVASSCKLRHK
jgi:agmatinase